jgi:REase_DpnII-MboI
VSSASEYLLVDARTALRRCLASRPQSDLAVVFGFWVFTDPADSTQARNIAIAAARRAGAQQDFQTVATLGFALDCGLLDVDIAPAMRQGLGRIAGRKPFVDEIPMPFCSDAVGILGVALGTRKLADAPLSNSTAIWLAGFLNRIYEMSGTEDWQRCLFHATDRVLNGQISVPESLSDQAADIRVVLTAKGILSPRVAEEAERDEQSALTLIARHSSDPISYERAAIRLAALDQVTRSAPVVVPGRMSAQSLVQLLERVPAGLRKWTWEKTPRTSAAPARQWHIDHEYHVQNLLWFTLAPLLPDLDDEQYLAKIAQKSPRADLYIPSMKLVIEAKFLRPTDKMQKIIDQISSDASLYGAMGNDCAGIVPFIWDDSARSQEHDYLRQGLKKLPGILDAVVVSRPNDWCTRRRKR